MNKIIIGVLSNIIVLQFVFGQATKRDLKETTILLEAVGAKQEDWKDEEGRLHSKIQVLETRKAKDFLALETKDSAILALQEVVANYKSQLKKGGNVTVFETVTVYDTTKKTSISWVTAWDSGFYLKDTFHNDFIHYELFANRDSISHSFLLFNSYSVIIGQEKEGWFKKKPFAEVINNNPYSHTKTVRTYQVAPPRPLRWGIGPQAGVTLGQNLSAQPYIGVGVSYNLIRF